MARVTDSEVKQIFNTDLDTTPFITAANLLVSAKLGSKTELSTAQLKEIERWLAAHFVSVRDQRTSSERVGNASATFTGKYGLGLEGSREGQTAMALDITGTLAKLGLKVANYNVISEVDITASECED